LSPPFLINSIIVTQYPINAMLSETNVKRVLAEKEKDLINDIETAFKN